MSLPTATRKKRTLRTGSGESSSEEVHIETTESQSGAQVAHDNKENIDSGPHEQITGKRPAGQQTRAKSAPRHGKQRAPTAAATRKTSGRAGSTSIEPESLEEPEPEAVVATKPARGKKRGRPAIESEEESGSKEHTRVKKKSRLTKTETTETYTNGKQNSSTSRTDATPEELKAAEDALQPTNIDKRGLSPNRKRDFSEMINNAIWDSDGTKRRKNKPRSMAFKNSDKGELIVADKHLDAGSPNLFFLDPVTALANLDHEVAVRSIKRKKKDREQAKHKKQEADKVIRKTTAAVERLGAAGFEGVMIEVDPAQYASPATEVPESRQAHEEELAMTGALYDVSMPDASPTAPRNAPGSAEPPVTPPPQPGYSRLTSFVNSVKRPFSWVPGFRSTPISQPQGSLSVAAGSAQVPMEQTSPSDLAQTPSQNRGESSTATKHSDVGMTTPEHEQNLQVGEHRIVLPDLTPIAPKSAVPDDHVQTDSTPRQKFVLTVEDFIQKELKRRLAVQKNELERKYEKQYAEKAKQLEDASNAAKAETERSMKELEHEFEVRAEERATAARQEMLDEIAKLKFDAGMSLTVSERARVSHFHVTKLGSTELPLTADGKIPGPANGGYGIDLEYLCAASPDDSVQSSGKIKETTKSPSTSFKRSFQPAVEDVSETDTPQATPAKRRKVTFDNVTYEKPVTPPGHATTLGASSSARPRSNVKSVLKKTSSYGTPVPKKRAAYPKSEREIYNPDTWPEPNDPDYFKYPGRTYGLDYDMFGSSSDEDEGEAAAAKKPAQKPVSEASAQATVTDKRKAAEAEKARQEKEAERMREVKQKAEFLRDGKYIPRTPSKLREAKQVSVSPQTAPTSVDDIMAKLKADPMSGALSVFVSV